MAGAPTAALLLVGIVHVVLVDHIGRREQGDDEYEVAENLAPYIIERV